MNAKAEQHGINVIFLHDMAGQYKQAINLFTALLRENPKIVAAYLGRGSANALSGAYESVSRMNVWVFV